MRIHLAAAGALLLAGCAFPGANSRIALVPSQVPDAIEQQLQQIGRVVDPPKTAALYAPLQQREPYAGVRVARDLRFGPDPQRNLLDVFTPESGGAARPVLVFVHGGGFTAGGRRAPGSPFYDNIGVWAVKNGMVAVNTTYRLAPQNPWPAAQEDLAATITWVRENIAARGGDPNRIYLMGHSAGAAHVAQYIGHPRFHVEPGGGIAGAILVSGLFDPSSATPSPALQSYFGTDASAYARRSALPGMAASRLPMLVAYAELDPSDFHEQAEQAQAALCAANHCGPLLQLRGHSHMSEVYAINTGDTALTDAIRAFVR
ncbi:alpha/beta hydrolase [Ramlibacter sp. USB13]|uniref:Alpha/beta hydrolase n=1 Tax=Ramlibacter cellulosilyticus TaxID=2764187 RepID=A0A923MV67_9BURK|nr:alpha/beta hydrolase [Ramlibacter cellulosilyticus]MBC5785626.1 alpha/beta hydrolase [Ramlibacter cellulosilyticus]